MFKHISFESFVNAVRLCIFYLQSTNDQKEKQLRSLTQMLLGVGILFLVCESPRAIMPIYHKFHPKTLQTRLINSATYVLSGVNHACNFFIYCLKGERFRKLLVEVLPCCEPKGKSGSMRSSSNLGGSVSTISTATG